MRHRRRQRALTAVEIAVVITILAIIGLVGLWAIGTFQRKAHYRPALPRPGATPTPVPWGLSARVLRNQRVALEAYAIDNGSYPLPCAQITAPKEPDAASSVTGAGRKPQVRTISGPPAFPSALTTPIAYLASVRVDADSPQRIHYGYSSYRYTDAKGKTYDLFLLIGSGPDLDRDFPLKSFLPIPESTRPPRWPADRKYGLPRLLIDYQYDPTNGLYSNGDRLLFYRPEGTWP